MSKEFETCPPEAELRDHESACRVRVLGTKVKHSSDAFIRCVRVPRRDALAVARGPCQSRGWITRWRDGS
jgi:hypothetical protein